MTKNELKSLVPKETMVYSNRDNVGYTFMGITEDGKYQLCGKPYPYEDYIVMNSFKLMRNK